VVDAAHNPGGMEASLDALHEAFDFPKVVGVVAVMRDKDVETLLDLLEPVLDEIVVTRNSSPRSMSPEELAAVAVPLFGEDRVRVVERLDDAIDMGIALADAEGEFSGTGVLITGSVVTAGDARHLLNADGVR
jgi:dihydrofolate synthase/folylpolyglutamate synthase